MIQSKNSNLENTILRNLYINVRTTCWLKDHVGGRDSYATGRRAFLAVQQYSFGKRGRPRFKSYNRIHSVESNGTDTITFILDPFPLIRWRGITNSAISRF